MRHKFKIFAGKQYHLWRKNKLNCMRLIDLIMGKDYCLMNWSVYLNDKYE